MSDIIKDKDMNQNIKQDTKQDTRRIPKYMFDAEYSTQRFKEYQFLHDRGIEPSYIKKSKSYNVTTFKYSKTPELFTAVAEFYRTILTKGADDDV